MNYYFKTQKITEAVFKQLNLIKDNEPDKEASMKYIENTVKDAAWNPVLKSALTKCFTDVTAQKDKILAELAKEPFKVAKDQCNGIFVSLVGCFQMESCKVS